MHRHVVIANLRQHIQIGNFFRHAFISFLKGQHVVQNEETDKQTKNNANVSAAFHDDIY